jgi:aspartate ammonia-lyase
MRRTVELQEAFQAKERELAGIVKVGRTEMQDALFATLGREMGAYAEAFTRDRWRICAWPKQGASSSAESRSRFYRGVSFMTAPPS